MLKNRYTGTIGDMGCYSFNGNKIITTGGGGMIVTNKVVYAKKAKYLTTQTNDDPIKYIHNEVGYNFRLTNIQAAMGVAQLEMLDKYIKIKKQNYLKYKKEIDKIEGLQIGQTPGYAQSNYWFYCLQIDKGIYGKNQGKLMPYLSSNGIQARSTWHLNYLQKPYKDCQSYKIENAYKMQAKTLNMPCSVDLKQQDIFRVVKVLRG